MENIPKANPLRSPVANRLSFLFIGVLVVIAAAVIWMQNRYDPTRWRERAGQLQQPVQAREAEISGLKPLSPAEIYRVDTLSDKINGKADLYLSAGFRSLEARRFALIDDNARWMERYVYDMGGHLNAFSVYSVQRRGDVQKLDITPHAYLSSNGLFMVHGPYYLEIIASEASEAIQSRLMALGQSFAERHPVTTDPIAELELFGSEHFVPRTTKLIAGSVFGIQGLDWIFTADYADGPARATAFAAKRDADDQAQASADAFIGFWNEYGAEPVTAPEHLPSLRIALILDNYEMVMVQGPYVYGVHEASSLDFGLKVMAQLNQTVGEVAR